ncbi:hypothetical protein AQ490_22830 [Wenjunlia vitaminophila]|uniref:Glycolipid-binding domain-containing protein n=1 Tax=Wenjunlia vitaminophila TaxID=76728 RepID=A0A0T6LRK8_WENVI|nr:hypothetical protein [Wenjunlia vitaminophila]KRV48717.1 hypothetical protein AQ490_22830 [Wenjunlia vitaminophila]
MPRGRYSRYDPYDSTPLGEEHFHCASGPSGWRYTAQTTTSSGEHSGSVDLTTDTLGRSLRLELHSAGWRVRAAHLDGLTWVRSDPTGEHAQEGNARAHGFTGASPAHLVATARLLRLTPGGPPTRVRLVAFTPPALAPRTLDQSWALTSTEAHPTDSGTLTVCNYQVTDLETGERHAIHLAGDVVLAAPGVELEDLDGPPSPLD